MNFDHASFWLQLQNLPLASMNKECGVRIGSSIGSVKDVEVDETNLGWGLFLRLKVYLNLKKPLTRGRTIIVEGKTF